MIVDVGSLALPIALLAAVYASAGSLLGGWRRVPVLVLSARYGFYTVPVLLTLSTAALVFAFVTHDFSVRYVAENSNLAMPPAYTWVAFYAGNAGSLLFIAFVFSIISVVAVRGLASRLTHTAPFSTGLIALVLAFFLGIITFLANPLERLAFTPPDGQGINPLLVHFGMFIHPPMQMAGLISVALPFSIAMGALLAGRGGRDEWVDIGRTWGMISWLVLTLGLMLGSWWAYTILGWGGYWAWDPVENSALMPWLAMTAFVHSIMVQKRRGMFRMWNIVLVAVAFTLAEMGMFINRGGPVPSVHSFAQSAMGWLFLAFMGFTLLGSLAAFAWRMDTLRSREALDGMLSRESAFLAQNVLFLVVAFATLWGTIYPVFTQASADVMIVVGQPYFNRVNGPLLLVIVVLMGIGPLAAVEARVLAARVEGHPRSPCSRGRDDDRPRGRGSPPARRPRGHRRRGPGRRWHSPRVGPGHPVAPQEGRELPRRLRAAAVGQPAALWRLRRASRHRNARNRGHRIVLLRSSAGLRDGARRYREPGGLHLHVPRVRQVRAPRQVRGRRQVLRERRGLGPGADGGQALHLSRIQDGVHQGGHQEHAAGGLLHSAVRVRGERQGSVPRLRQPARLVDVGVGAPLRAGDPARPLPQEGARRRGPAYPRDGQARRRVTGVPESSPLLVLVGLALVAIPLAAILYPFLRRRGLHGVLADEEPHDDLDRRWDAALAGLRSAELERAIGTLGEEDYQVLREQYMTEAALVLRSLEMEAGREADLLASVEEEIRRVREGFLGDDDPNSERAE